jgi:hypothetical protein
VQRPSRVDIPCCEHCAPHPCKQGRAIALSAPADDPLSRSLTAHKSAAYCRTPWRAHAAYRETRVPTPHDDRGTEVCRCRLCCASRYTTQPPPRAMDTKDGAVKTHHARVQAFPQTVHRGELARAVGVGCRCQKRRNTWPKGGGTIVNAGRIEREETNQEREGSWPGAPHAFLPSLQATPAAQAARRR